MSYEQFILVPTSDSEDWKKKTKTNNNQKDYF